MKLSCYIVQHQLHMEWIAPRGDFYFLCVWAALGGLALAVRWVHWSWREVCVCVSTGSIRLQPLGLCTQAGLYQLCLAAPIEITTSRGVTNLICTAGNTQVFAKEQLIAGNQFSLVDSSCMKPVTWSHCWGPNMLRDGVSPMCASDCREVAGHWWRPRVPRWERLEACLCLLQVRRLKSHWGAPLLSGCLPRQTGGRNGSSTWEPGTALNPCERWPAVVHAISGKMTTAPGHRSSS